VESPAAAAREARITRQLAATPDATPSLADWSAGLPGFDARYTPDGLPGVDASLALAKLKASPAWEARQAEVLALSGSIPELRIDDHAIFATPAFVRSTRTFLTDPAPGLAPADVVARYIHDHAALFEIDALEIPAAKTVRDFRTDHNGVTHLTFQQQLRGLDLFGCQIRANVMPDGRLINISSSMLPRAIGEGGDLTAPVHQISAADAIVAAARAAGIALAEVPRSADDPVGLTERTAWHPVAQLRADEPVVTEKVYFPMTRDDIRAAYSVVIPVPGVGHTYEIVVDAADGSLLLRGNRLVWDSTQPVTMRVYPSDGVAPMSPGPQVLSAIQAPLASRELITVNPADVIAFSPNGWINDNDTQTLGNNIDAHLDLNGDNTPDTPRPDGGAARVFDFPMDPSQSPSAYAQAAVAQVFYLGNRFHDRLYALGFNEAAGNFQAVNFTGAGSGNDRLSIDAQDGFGTASPPFNNANFNGTGGDGSSARVQMYIFNGPSPYRDGDFASDIVYHEFAHGLSTRLHGGIPFNAMQTRGMGEGWSDYFGISLLAEPTDDPDANYAMSGYLTYQFNSPTFHTNFYFGIRRYPYSTSFNINPLTFADIDMAQFAVPTNVPRSPVARGDASEEHNVGEIWCNMLLECRAQLWNRDGFSGNQLMMQLVVDGMKLSPAAPNFVQARDAILQADLVNNASANRVPLWAGFSKRGLGLRAAAPSSTSTSGATESFAVPFTADFTYPDGLPTQLTPGEPTPFRVHLTPTDLTISPNSQALVYRINSGPEVVSPLAPGSSPSDFIATIPPMACFDRIRFTLRTGTNFGDYSDPTTGFYSAMAFTGSTVVVNDDFETDTGWTVGPDTAVTGQWMRVDPIGTPVQPEDDHTEAPGATCWVTGQGLVGGLLGDADVDGGATILTSPSYNLADAAAVTVSYWRWYSNGAAGIPYADTFRVDVSTDDGATWVNAETVGPGSATDPDTNPGWRFARWNFNDLGLTPTAHVRVRFIAEDAGAGSAIEAAIDDFRIERIACSPAANCRADINHSGDVGVQDLLDFLVAYFGGESTADFNGADGISVQDIFDFLAAYFAGCP
jgi:hypothetical protein